MELPAHLELTPAWRDFRAGLRRAVGETAYEIWLAQLQAISWDGGTLVLAAPATTQTWVAARFGRLLQRCADAAFGTEVTITFAQQGPVPATAREPHTGPTITDTLALDRFIPRCTFDQFIIGDGNRLAHGAALAVAEAPGQTYNPLFLYAPPGLGKTHLLHAIANYITACDPGTTVRYTTVEAFTNGFISALSMRAIDHFKHVYRDVDVLLVDDVQFLASKAKTEEELFHTFNALYDSGRQLVLTCDRLPRQLVGLEQRLRERFESGLVAELSPPDRTTRLAILRKRADLDRIEIPDPAVLELIADRVTDNVRSLEGALIRTVAHHSLTGSPLDIDLAAAVLDEIHPAPAGGRRSLTIAIIQAEVASYFEITLEDMLSASRAGPVAWARQVAIHLARDLTNASLQAIGTAFGGRNHATVLHACKRVSDRISSSTEDAGDVQNLRTALTGSPSDRDC